MESAMKIVDANELIETTRGRDSVSTTTSEEEAIPVKVLSKEFEVAANQQAKRKKKEEDALLRVYCRLRPLGRGEEGGGVEAISKTSVVCLGSKRPGQRMAKEYEFSRVFGPEENQAQIYVETTRPLVDALFKGQSSLIFAYGVTNAGKSYTIMGSGESERSGLLPRALDDILRRAEDDGYSVSLSFIEIYNDQVFDLMDKPPAATHSHRQVSNFRAWGRGGITSTQPAWGGARGDGRRALRVKDLHTRMEVSNLSSANVLSVSHGVALARAAEAQRKTASTGLNATSSRSHAICQIELRTKDSGPLDSPYSQLNIVDLAGSERAERTGASGAAQKEANHINQSISQLMRCLRALKDRSTKDVVPWRDSKLTYLFQYLLAPGPPPTDNTITSFSEEGTSSPPKVVMIVNVSPSANDRNESAFALANAANAKTVAIRPQANFSTTTNTATTTIEYDRNGRRVVIDANAADSRKRKADKSTEQLQRDDCIKNMNAPPLPPRPTESNNQREEQFYRQKALALEAAVTQLEAKLAMTEAQVAQVEQEVRTECAEEMANTIAMIQKDYTRRLRARSSVALGANLPLLAEEDDDAISNLQDDDDFDNNDLDKEEEDNDAISNKRQKLGDFASKLEASARKDRHRSALEAYVESLEEQVEETEAELQRVRNQWTAQVKALKSRLQNAGLDLDAIDDDELDDEVLDRRATQQQDRNRDPFAERGSPTPPLQKQQIVDTGFFEKNNSLIDTLNKLDAVCAASVADAASTRHSLTILETELFDTKALLFTVKAELATATNRADIAERSLAQAKKQKQQATNELNRASVIYADAADSRHDAPSDVAPPPPPAQRRKSPSRSPNRAPLKENSPRRAIPERKVKTVVETFDARARAIMDERLARAKAQQLRLP
eukprot:CAMPEP_0197312236 /NCGR_PEP_ID=MMETSP0891-20130614/18685_1 /TAXON_ID=44058 ORGANISM="Aureoumbra lagunensis, Strain CCMP1510" /NCGR_SAMPLE_ID=MMETSP0891 /ASSEMBLY_ACC=CAM_ASM_000534 /LENGTH=899 /DNA_ID=CAMNT_0042799195 /DNA_START=76 /DNA_END=2775 /DNA_ORIENTATION=-